MIKMEEIVKGVRIEALPKETQANLNVLLEKINRVRKEYGKPMRITSGLRSMEDHLRIYREKGITDRTKIPMKSKHLFGQALDVADPTGKLMAWCIANEKLLETIGLWMEHGSATKGWVHFQTVPPASGNRFFMP